MIDHFYHQVTSTCGEKLEVGTEMTAATFLSPAGTVKNFTKQNVAVIDKNSEKEAVNGLDSTVRTKTGDGI